MVEQEYTGFFKVSLKKISNSFKKYQFETHLGSNLS